MASKLLDILYERPAIAVTAIPLVYVLAKLLRPPRRLSKILKRDERVLVLGATSGIGREIAHQYSKRGARVCVVGRREKNVEDVVVECRALNDGETKVLGLVGDFSSSEDMVRIRETLRKEWNGIDTIIISAGVSALQPILSLAGVEAQGDTFTPPDASKEGIDEAVRIAHAAHQGNFVGPLVTAVTFIPFLTQTSKSPSILLVSSAGAFIPAPTRALYGASKGASLLLYQGLAIEHPSISFTFVLPGTVEGDFRASAVDKGPVREADPNKFGLKASLVARRCIESVDGQVKVVVMPWVMMLAHFMYWVYPPLTEGFARKKYNYPVEEEEA